MNDNGATKRPYIICHMMASVDGRIDCDMTEKIGGDEYYDALAGLDCDSTLSGRVTMQMHYALPGTFEPRDTTPIGHESVHKAAGGGYEIATDTHGRLLWPDRTDDGQPLLVITCEDVPAEYLDTLRQKGISWIATGHGHIDLGRAMELLATDFGVRRLAIVGGGHINGGFLSCGLLDEVSIVIGAGIDGRSGMTAVFDGIDDPDRPVTLLRLTDVRRIGDDSVWLRYAVG